MRKFILLIVIVIVLGIILIALFLRGSENSLQTTPPRPAPDFTLKDYAGAEIQLADFRGQNLIINSWASWCPFCRKELQEFAAVKKEFGNAVVIIAIDRAESLETAKRYSEELGVTNELIFLLDSEDSFYQSIGGFSMPETIFVDRNGLIRDHKRGPMDREEFRRRIQQAFNL